MSELPYPAFPRQLRARLLPEGDPTFLLVLLILFSLVAPTTLLLRHLPPPEVDEGQRRELLRVLYRAPGPPPPPPLAGTRPAPRAESSPAPEALAEEEPAATVREQPRLQRVGETTAERVQRLQRAREEREATDREQVERVRRTGIFAVAGAHDPPAAGGGGGAAAALALGEGSVEGRALREVERVATAPTGATGAELPLRRELEGEHDPAPELAAPTVHLEGAPTLRAADPSRAREAGVLGEQVRARLPSLQRCFLAQRERDPGLRGAVVARITVAPGGEVVRVRLHSGAWSNPLLGRRAARCLELAIGRWSFPPAEGGGETTLDVPLRFG